MGGLEIKNKIVGPFELTEEQIKKYEEWRSSKKGSYRGPIGGGYTFCFTPISIGVIVVVKCDDGTHLDLTEYENF